MFLRFLGLSAILIMVTDQAGFASVPPPRYLPAPKSVLYYMLFGNTAMMAEVQSKEKEEQAGEPGILKDISNQWRKENYELATMVGYGMGSFWFLHGIDFSLYLPFNFQSFRHIGYLAESDPRDIMAARAQNTLHASVRNGPSGQGRLGDLSFSTMALFYANHEAATWASTSFKLILPTAPSAGERFARILHGEHLPPTSGYGVARLTPALSLLKGVGGQRAYFDIEYAVPLGKETFSFTSPNLFHSVFPYDDADMDFRDEIVRGGVLLCTVGMETSLDIFGVAPSIELGVRHYQAAKWTENETDGLAPTTAPAGTIAYPSHTSSFLTNAAWVIGDLPLKDNTEIEISLLGTYRIRANDIVKAGVSYIKNSYGNAVGVRVSFTNLFIQRAESEGGPSIASGPQARELEVSPTMEAPPAPTREVIAGVTLPVFTAPLTREHADWVAGQIRYVAGRLRGYRVVPVAAMAQLASSPCNDAACGSRFGHALNANAMIVGDLVQTVSGFTFSAALVNVMDGQEVSRSSASAATLEELKDEFPALLDRLTQTPIERTP